MGTGCNIGDNVATQYLGQSTYYGNTSIIVQSYSNSKIINIAREQGYAGYRCNTINVYSAGTKNGMAYPGANEVLQDYAGQASHKCVVVSSYSSNVTSTSGEGFELQYRYNDPAYYSRNDTSNPQWVCNTVLTPMPVDDGIWVLLSFSGIAAVTMMYRAKKGVGLSL